MAPAATTTLRAPPRHGSEAVLGARWALLVATEYRAVMLARIWIPLPLSRIETLQRRVEELEHQQREDKEEPQRTPEEARRELEQVQADLVKAEEEIRAEQPRVGVGRGGRAGAGGKPGGVGRALPPPSPSPPGAMPASSDDALFSL